MWKAFSTSNRLRPIRLKQFRKPRELAPGDDRGADAARHVEHAERGDERRQPDAGREPRVEHARQRARGERRDDGDPRRRRHLMHQERRDGAGECQHRAHREVDVAVRHHEGEADREQRDLGKRQQDGETVVEPAPEIGPRPQAEQPQRHRQQDRRRVAPIQKPHDAARMQTARTVPRCRGSAPRRWRCRRDPAPVAPAARAAAPIAGGARAGAPATARSAPPRSG